MTTAGFVAQTRLMGFTVEYPARTYTEGKFMTREHSFPLWEHQSTLLGIFENTLSFGSPAPHLSHGRIYHFKNKEQQLLNY